MPDTRPDPLFDAFLKARDRGILPTSLDTAGLRDLTAQQRLSSVFTARGTSVILASKIKEVIDLLAAGEINEATAVGTLFETVRALGYTPEGGFPQLPGDAGPVPPAVQGTIEDLSSLRRLTLIVRTQLEIQTGAGQQYRGHTPARLEAAPGWELIRVLSHRDHRPWNARWITAGGKKPYPHNGSIENVREETGLIALKGDPIWGELGSSGNFPDGLDIDHSPFVFQGGVGLREVRRDRLERLGVIGPNGESIDAWLASRPPTLAGKLPIPAPKLSLADVDPEMLESFKLDTGAVEIEGKPGLMTLPRMTPAERGRRAAELRNAQKAAEGGGQ